MLQGICICQNEHEGSSISLKGQCFNLKAAGSNSLSKSCSNQYRPCFVYSTIPQLATTQVFINVHTHVSIELPQNLTIWKDTGEFTSEYYSTVFQFDDLNEEDQRNIHTFVITDLEPNSTYSFYFSLKGVRSDLFKYKTLPEYIDENDELNIVNGGGIGHSTQSNEIWQSLHEVKPDIIFIGGDISYDNNLIDCAWTMDILLENYQAMSQRVGRLVPIVLAIGDHDIGLNAGSQRFQSLFLIVNRKIQIKDRQAKPFYFSYFPQHLDLQRQDKITPIISNRKSYFHHTFANVVFFTLDTEYVSSMKEQGQYIEKVLKNLDRKTIKMSHYHNPLYSISYGERDDGIVFYNGVQYWSPKFDKYKFITNFENHSNLQKRSKLLKSSVEAINGTLFLGDGSWGTTNSQCSGELPDYLLKCQKENSVWITSITNKYIFIIQFYLQFRNPSCIWEWRIYI